MILFSVLISIQLLNAFELECDYVTSGWYVVGEVKNCYGRKVDLISPGPIVESVNGNNASKLYDVKGFWIDNEVCHYMPEKLTEFFPSLTALGISNSGLKVLTKFDLEPFYELRRFAFYKNELEYIENDLFKYNPKLESVSLTDNNLMVIGESFLETISKLTYAQVEIRCFKNTCETRSCLSDIKSELKRHCQSDAVIFNFKKEIQRLGNELLKIKSETESCSFIESQARIAD